MTNKSIPMSPEGIHKIERDLYDLVEVRRPDMLRSLQEAREKGDLSENAEYGAAREGLTQIDMQIGKLQRLLGSVVLVDDADIPTDRVGLMTLVKLINLKTNKEVQYRIVSGEEADPRMGKISSSSPVGKALLDKVVGDEVEVEVPVGIVKYRIAEIGK